MGTDIGDDNIVGGRGPGTEIGDVYIWEGGDSLLGFGPQGQKFGMLILGGSVPCGVETGGGSGGLWTDMREFWGKHRIC